MSAPVCECCGQPVRGVCYRCAHGIARRSCSCACAEDRGPLLPPSPAVALGAVTVLQPWASCIIPGPKPWENRTWRLPGVERGGRWIAVHAGLQYDRSTVDDAILVEQLRELWPGMPRMGRFPLGAVLGLVHVDACIDLLAVDIDDPWAAGPIGWHLDYKVALPTPEVCRGAQGAWTVPAGIARRLYQLFPRPIEGPPPTGIASSPLEAA